jgi:molecular chaperone GrpE
MAKKKKKKVEEEIVKQPKTDNKNVETSENKSGEKASAEKEDIIEEEEKDPVEALQKELEEQKDKYIRLMAEFDNYKRRTGKEYERLIELANERLMSDIIEVRESFDRAINMAGENHDLPAFLEGMKLIFNKLEDSLKKNGLSVFTEVGDEFDAEIHDAMMKTPHDEIQEDHITEIYEKGYKLKNHVIKHAKVIVSAGKASDAVKENAENEEAQETVNE